MGSFGCGSLRTVNLKKSKPKEFMKTRIKEKK
jgi:hypothetical protein